MARSKYYTKPANGPYGYPRGNRAMASKRTSGPTPNTEMLTRMREQELRLGGTSYYNSRTGVRKVLAHLPTNTLGQVTIRDEHYH